MGAISVGPIDHINIRTRKFAETLEFYVQALGLTKGPRPDFGFPGAWLYSGDKAVLHLVDLSQTSEPQKPDSGVLDHVAFGCTGFQAMKERLAARGVSFRSREVPGRDIWQIFLRDPNGLTIELNFDMSQELR